MATLYQTVSSCLQKKTSQSECTEPSYDDMEPVIVHPPADVDEVKEHDAPELRSDKKTDEIIAPEKPVSLVWRVSSGLYNTTTGALTGAVGLSVGGVKWVAGKGYDAGSAVITTTKTVVSKVQVPLPRLKTKPKKE